MTSLNSEEKIRDISQYLRKNILDVAEDEKKKIIDEAETEKKRIIEDAEKKASEILKSAHEQAEQEKRNSESAIKIAAKQAVGILKQNLEKEVLKKVIDKPVKEINGNNDVMKELLKEVLNIYLTKETSGASELVVSDKIKKDLSDFIKSEIIAMSNNKMTLSEETIPEGFAVTIKENGLMFDFSSSALIELISNYVRPEVRNYLFEK